MIQIYTNGGIILDGVPMKFTVHQTNKGTIVRDSLGNIQPMPSPCYSLSCWEPASGIPGIGQFEADFLALVRK